MHRRPHGAWRFTLLAFVATAAALLVPATTWAHANLDRATPAPNAVLDAAPGRVTIWFTEPVEQQFSGVQVLNSAGDRVDSGHVVFDPADRTVMSVGLSPGLPNGTYTVSWRTLSTVDGHTVREAFLFSVGESGSGEKPAVQQAVVQSSFDPVVRWLTLLSALVLTGGLAVDSLVWRPVLTGKDSPASHTALRSRMVSRFRRLWWAAAAIFAVASVAWLLVQASVAGASPVAILSGTDWGRLWLWRAALFVGLCAVFAMEYSQRSSRRRSRDDLPLLSLAMGPGLLLTFSLASHGAAVPGLETPGVLSDYLHLLASALWAGGLVFLAAGIPLAMTALEGEERRITLARMAPRFSFLAALSVAVLTVTGLYGAWLQVTVFPALLAPFGLALLAKAAVIAVILGIAAFNLFWVSPRLHSHDRAGGLLRRTVIGEAALATVVILLVGAMTSMEPARQAAPRLGLVSTSPSVTERVEGLNIAAVVEPGQVGPNDIQVVLTDRQDRPVDVTDVTLILRYLGTDLGDQTVATQHLSDGVYVAEGRNLSIAGPWQAEVLVRRPDTFDARTAFRFDVKTAAGTGAAIVPSPATGRLLWGIELIVLGALLVSTGVPLGGWWRRRGQAFMVPGVAVFLIGLALAANVQFAGEGQHQEEVTVNPILPSAESLETGGRLYTRDCAECHGAAGRGDGPRAPAVDPSLMDLTLHVPVHDDRSLFLFIQQGVPGSAMPAWGDTYTDEEIWHTVNYLQNLATASTPTVQP